jgi:hypothetical protein
MGCSRKQAAEHVGIGPSTLFRALREDRNFATQLRRATMQQDITPLRRILEQSQTSWRAAAWILERQNPSRYARRSPMMVTRADCMAFLKSVLGFLIKGPCLEDRQRVLENLKRLDELLSGCDLTTPMGRRVVRQMSEADDLAAPPAAENPPGGANCWSSGTAPESPSIAEIADANREIPAFDEGGGI